MSGEEEDALALFQNYTNQVHSVLVEEEDEGPDWEFTKLITTEFRLQEAIISLLKNQKTKGSSNEDFNPEV